MDMQRWLESWLKKHPPREPGDGEKQRFTAEVMRRVREPETAREPVRAGLALPRWSLGLAAACASVAIGVALFNRSAPPVATGPGPSLAMTEQPSGDIDADLQLLAELDPAALIDLLPAEDLAAYSEALDAVELTQLAQEADSEWVEEAIELLDAVGEGEDLGDVDIELENAVLDALEWEESVGS